jgi:hypothetical protein
MFYAGAQSYLNSLFGRTSAEANQYYFNLVQQPVNMITGYQRQHMRSITYVPCALDDSETTDQYTSLIGNVCSLEGLYERYSKSCELAAISGMNLIQPYLDFTSHDQAQGDLKLKIWEYNSFIIDPYFRNPDMSDARCIWCQEYLSRDEAMLRFPDEAEKIKVIPQGRPLQNHFYFLPEASTMIQNGLLVQSFIWTRKRRPRKRLYSRSRNQFFDFVGTQSYLNSLVDNVTDLKEVTVQVPSWNLCVLINDTLVYEGDNPLGFDLTPFVPMYWNYDPHLNRPDMRDRSLIRTMRDPQFLFNYKVINNNDIAAASINAGWKRLSGAVANEENLKRTGQGWDIVINEGYTLADCEKIVPSAVPQSDIELAEQMANLIYKTSGIDMENWAGQDDYRISSLTMLLKQAANLTIFQKYFDQWDNSLKILGSLMLQVVLHNWSPEKIETIIGSTPSPLFYNYMFSRYQVVVAEGLLTPTQRNMQAQQMLEINQAFGREVFAPSFIIKDMNLQGKAEAVKYLQQQEQAAQEIQNQQMLMAQAAEDAKLKEAYSRATANIAMAKERYGRTESNIGLFEERLSEITQNRAMAAKNKVEALEKLINVISQFGELETALKMQDLQKIEDEQVSSEDAEKIDAKKTSLANEFESSLISNQMSGNSPETNVPPEESPQQGSAIPSI